MPVCLQIMQALKMHKGVNELRLLSNTLTYQSCVRVVCFSCIK